MPVQHLSSVSSQTELHTPLARPVKVGGEAPRAFLTVLDALATLNDHAAASAHDADDVIDALIRAARSNDPALLARATDHFEQTLQRWYAVPGSTPWPR